ncbi:hypothetical protein BDV93DRAFT_550086 [Ceratobasidium sp. AG-I]|nr:hypothetical protein BDV93DRAFT_550086 [Ceratobasidium sp. AG-I]
MTSHESSASSSLLPPSTPPQRPQRPRISRGISSRRPQPPPVPPSLRDHPLLDVVANGNSSAASSSSNSTGVTPIPTPHSRRSSLSTTSPLFRATDKIPLPSPTGLWTLPPRPSPPLAGPWSPPTIPDPVGDAMGLLDTVPAGSTISAASPGGYPWHAPGAGRGRAQGYEYMSMPPNMPAYALYPASTPTSSSGMSARRHAHAPPHPRAHANTGRSAGGSPSKNGQRHNVGTLHTHSPQPSPPVTPAAA